MWLVSFTVAENESPLLRGCLMALSHAPLGPCAMSRVNRHMLRAAGGFFSSYGTQHGFYCFFFPPLSFYLNLARKHSHPKQSQTLHRTLWNIWRYLGNKGNMWSAPLVIFYPVVRDHMTWNSGVVFPTLKVSRRKWRRTRDMPNNLYPGIRRPNGSYCAAHILINVIFSSGAKRPHQTIYLSENVTFYSVWNSSKI